MNSIQYFFKNLRLPVKVAMLLLAAAIPVGGYVLLNNGSGAAGPQTPAPLSSPDTPLAFPFDTTTTTTIPAVVTTPEASTTLGLPQCSDGRDNDRDGKIDLRDPGCSSRSDRSEFNRVVISPSPSPRPSPSPSPSPRPSPSPSPSPRPSPSPSPSPRPSPSPTRIVCVDRRYPLQTVPCPPSIN